MPEGPIAARSVRPWLLALAAVAVCGPWPGWHPPPVALAAVCGLLLILARPARRAWLPWAAVAVALAGALWPAGDRFDSRRLSSRLEGHCREMAHTAEALVSETVLVRLLSAAGEAVDPALPFELLDRAAAEARGRTIYLADDRGRIIAWGGVGNAFPRGVRPLGQRQWGLAWSVGTCELWTREPLLVEGRLIGAVVIVDRSPLQDRRVWGMEAVRGRLLALGQQRSDSITVRVTGRPGIEVPVAERPDPAGATVPWHWLGWLLLALLALRYERRWAWLVVLGGAASVFADPGPTAAVVPAVIVLLGGAAAGRLSGSLRPPASKLLVAALLAAAAVLAVIGSPDVFLQWLPSQLLRPGWGGVWMVSLAWLLSGWPGLSRSTLSLERRIRGAVLLAMLGLATSALRFPVLLERSHGPGEGVVLPRHDLEASLVFPVDPEDTRVDDLAPVLAKRWRLDAWSTPSQLVLTRGDVEELSRWGDLSPAGGDIDTIRRWQLDEPTGWAVELGVARPPWRWLRDWRPGRPLESARRRPVWFAVLTRSGEVAATVHPEIEGLDAVRAGELFYDGGGWTRVTVGDTTRLAKVRREESWLVVAAANHPSAADWVVRTAIAMLWALVGSLIVAPPIVSRQQLSTFGGRLRLLVAGGVVLPLAVLTLFLHQRLAGQEARLDQERALEALRAARYTAVHLGGGFAVDDALARWLASGWGGEVAIWDGTTLAAVSRPDLVSTGKLPPLPLPASFPPYLIGRDDATVRRWCGLEVAAGPVNLQGRQLLLHLFLSDPENAGSELGAVDWLLTGACLSALLALVLTTRVEQRLSSSLRELMVLARNLVDGKPVGTLQRPPETDLAEVLDAVGSMNEQVQQRELKLRYQEELLRITLKTLESAVVVLEPDGARRFANSSARKLEAEHGELVLDHLRSVIEDASVGGSAAKTVQPVPGRDLTWRIGVAAVPFPDGSRGLVAVVDDVTELVRADRARQLNELARIVAHEVKNPLTPVRLWVQELEAALAGDDPELHPLLEEACREIAVQVARLQETANSFSNLVALEEWVAGPVDVAALLASVPSGREIFERRGIRFELEIPEVPPPPVVGDRHWLRRAFANLVQNSVDAIGDGPGTVTVRVDEAAEHVVVEVEDSGGGVPDDRLPELFAPHFSTTTSGSGLGLALVRQVVTRCQGTVEAGNGDQGLVVRIALPKPASTFDGAMPGRSDA